MLALHFSFFGNKQAHWWDKIWCMRTFERSVHGWKQLSAIPNLKFFNKSKSQFWRTSASSAADCPTTCYSVKTDDVSGFMTLTGYTKSGSLCHRSCSTCFSCFDTQSWSRINNEANQCWCWQIRFPFDWTITLNQSHHSRSTPHQRLQKQNPSKSADIPWSFRAVPTVQTCVLTLCREVSAARSHQQAKGGGQINTCQAAGSELPANGNWFWENGKQLCESGEVVTWNTGRGVFHLSLLPTKVLINWKL